VTARDATLGSTRSAFTALLRGRPVPVTLQLPGSFNVDNALLALATAEAAGIDPEAGVTGIAELTGVPGRMERIDEGQPFTVLVDYAHTPDSVASVLRAARPLTSGRVLIVIGCGGERDRGKRRLIGRQAVASADLAIFTNDNPRGEDPASILEAIASGARWVAGGRWTIEEDRRAAIALALDQAEPGDVVVIAGKGHETYQEIGDRKLPFDDRAVARSLLAGTNPAAPVTPGGRARWSR
jgi:UDP-N-acetylmuramoyl-L-alanyl-D-glutamate--2,6-diaminopimelate ligase